MHIKASTGWDVLLWTIEQAKVYIVRIDNIAQRLGSGSSLIKHSDMAQPVCVPHIGTDEHQHLKENFHTDQSVLDFGRSENDRLPVHPVQTKHGVKEGIHNGVHDVHMGVHHPQPDGVKKVHLSIEHPAQITDEINDKISKETPDSGKHGSTGLKTRPTPEHQTGKNEYCSSNSSQDDISTTSTITDVSNDTADTPDTADTDISDTETTDEIRDTTPPPSYQEAMLEALDAVNHNVNQNANIVGIPNIINSIPNVHTPGSALLNDDDVPSYEETVNTPFLPRKTVLTNALGNQIGNSLGTPAQNVSMRSINSINALNNTNSPNVHNTSPNGHNLQIFNPHGNRKTSLAHTNDTVSVHTYVHSDYNPDYHSDYHSEFQDYASAFSSGIHTPLQSHVGTPTLHSSAPDGGYGWVVCFASFLIMIILDGMLFSFGVFFLDLLEYFQEGKGKTAWVGSTLMGTHLIVGELLYHTTNLWTIC